ncbi:MAG: phage holin family protein [Bacilli bacterium]|nr:phage holin family protein [Bacilli bacterium]
MSFSGPLIICIICYLFFEIYKVIFKKKEQLYQLIPIFTSFLGALIATIIYFTNKELLFNVKTIYEAIIIGVLSGECATGSNQIFKQLKKGFNQNE